MSPDSLPDYSHPPVVETILGVQFEPLADLTNGHLGVFWHSLGPDWPHVEDAPYLESQFERFGDDVQWLDPGIRLRFSRIPPNRLKVRNVTRDRMIQIQNGRFHYNWLGRGGSDYPRYDAVREQFLHYFREFSTFLTGLETKSHNDIKPNQWEITYLNHIPKGTVWNSVRDWSFFKLLTGVCDINNQPLESFSGQWHFALPAQQGRLHIEWKHSQHNSRSDATDELIVLTLTARGPVMEQDDLESSIMDGLDTGRMAIVQSFRDLMSDDANTFWGLNDGRN